MTHSQQPIRLGVSACLLGDEVRYDGSHKRDAFLTDVLGAFVEWVKVCPEDESGMGTPREAIRLVDQDGRLRLLTVNTGVDHTDRMKKYARDRLNELANANLCGWVLKKDSPSCRLERVKLHRVGGRAIKSGTGIFARALLARFPDLPVEEEDRLSDSRFRENFIERVFAYRRLRDLFDGRWTIRDLVRFHTAHKLVLMAHSPSAYARLGRLVARARETPRAAVRARYTAGFMKALAVTCARPSRKT